MSAMEQQNQEGLHYLPITLQVAVPREQVALAIPVAKWDELVARIQSFKTDFRFLTVAYSIFFGIGVTAGLSIAPLLISGIAAWVIGVYAAITICGFAIGGVLVVSERLLGQQQTSQIALLTSEMESLKDEYLEVPASG